MDPVATIPFQRVAGSPKLDDLWLFTGSVCNLRCLHCYTGSAPANHTLAPLTPADVAPFLDEARELGAAQIYLTGGEPFLAPEIAGLLRDCLAVAPTTVLTNGTEPLRKHWDTIRALRDAHGDRLQFRVSLDHHEPARHDAIRRDGAGKLRDAFAVTADTIVELSRMGFTPIVTLSAEVFRGNPASAAAVSQRVIADFAARGATVTVKILPATLDQGHQVQRRDRAPVVPRATDAYLRMTRTTPAQLMCHASRLVLKPAGAAAPRVYPCPVLVPSDEASAASLAATFDLGGTLTESIERPVPLDHPSCAAYCCNAAGTCGNGG